MTTPIPPLGVEVAFAAAVAEVLDAAEVAGGGAAGPVSSVAGTKAAASRGISPTEPPDTVVPSTLSVVAAASFA